MKRKRLIAAALAAVLTLGMAGMTSYGASRTKISSVSLKVEAEIVVGTDPDEQEIMIEPRSERVNYSVMDYEFLDTAFVWQEEDVPRLKVTLAAEDGYYFYLNTSDVTVRGASVEKADRGDDNETLTVTMTLPPLAEQVTEIDEESMVWTGDTTVQWEPSIGAGSYDVKLVRDGNTVGATKTITGITYDFSYAMTKAGSYSFKVRPVNRLKPENKGRWVESQLKTVDAAMAERIRANGSKGSWLQDDKGFWYRNADGSYTVSNWQQIDGLWYYFDENGYRKTGWIEVGGKSYYCDSATGAMLVNTTTPDNKTVGADGALVQ